MSVLTRKRPYLYSLWTDSDTCLLNLEDVLDSGSFGLDRSLIQSKWFTVELIMFILCSLNPMSQHHGSSFFKNLALKHIFEV